MLRPVLLIRACPCLCGLLFFLLAASLLVLCLHLAALLVLTLR